MAMVNPPGNSGLLVNLHILGRFRVGQRGLIYVRGKGVMMIGWFSLEERHEATKISGAGLGEVTDSLVKQKIKSNLDSCHSRYNSDSKSQQCCD